MYGTCDISARSIVGGVTNCLLRLRLLTEESVQFVTTAPLGTEIIDELELNTSLGSSTAWTVLNSQTNYISPDGAHFEDGSAEIFRALRRSDLPEAEALFFRMRRVSLRPSGL